MDRLTPAGSSSGSCSREPSRDGHEEQPRKRSKLNSSNRDDDEVDESPTAANHEGYTSNIQRDGFICLSDETHDIEKIGCHLPKLSSFVERLESAYRYCRGNARDHYRKVSALLLQFAEDDLGVASELEHLADMFRNTYRFTVDIFKIPSSKQRNSQIFHKVDSFLSDSDSPDHLCIMYYRGHAVKEGHTQPIWVSLVHPLTKSEL